MQKHEWKNKINQLMKECHQELSKATVIGKKMITATHTNTALQQSYQELGRLAAKHLNAGILEWENPRVRELLGEIEKCEKELNLMENEVQGIKKR